MSIVWNDKGFQLNGTQFQLITNLHDLFALKDQEGLVLGKPRDLIETYLGKKSTVPHDGIMIGLDPGKCQLRDPT